MFHSFIYASKGIFTAYKESRNLRFHFWFGGFVVLMGFYFDIHPVEWLFLILYVGAITSAEMFNTAIEDIMNILRDKVGVDYSFTGRAKDIAAGATLAVTIAAVVTGFLVFFPRILNLFF